MITISFHMISLLIGIVIGIFVGGFVFCLTFFGERWSVGFSDGWELGRKYAERTKPDD